MSYLSAYPKINSEVPEKSGVEAFARIFPAPFRNFGICTKSDITAIAHKVELAFRAIALDASAQHQLAGISSEGYLCLCLWMFLANC
jgi:hypothetical protein